jgi:hypothetical protein
MNGLRMTRQSFRLAAFLAAALGVGGALLGATPAKAAPQILGLVASNGLPTPLRCQAGSCTGSLASFCLQEARNAPSAGSDYRLAPGTHLTLLAATSGGRSLRLPANELLGIQSRLGFTAVKVSLPEAKLLALGLDPRRLVSLAVEIGPGATLLPIAAADDPNPQTPDEVAHASGPLRQLAARTFDQPGETTDAARLIGILADRLPAEAQASIALDELWRQVAEAAAGRTSAAGLAAAGRIVEGCRHAVMTPDSFVLGVCLDMREADLLATLNRRFWDQAGGS